MRYTTLGNSDLTISRICLGCMSFGDPEAGQHSWTLDEDASRAIVRQALDAGINFFDTAIVYQSGTSEEYLGRALRDMAAREQVVVATKFLPRTDAEITTLERPYRPHPIVGVMAQNTKENAAAPKIWGK